ncbi:MAG: hypothetical protein OXC82_13425 [Rhodobacteraceae bacterium]|nr:hypothetical protein [Paracoccaceae bacterium]MCY4251421.1 hypothetical protein [Paracoccaceae bacterium]
MPMTARQQTVRAKPERTYCISAYSLIPEAVSFRGKSDKGTAVSYNRFATPPAPDPWIPDPENTGCGTETSLDLVRQCFRCISGSWT